MQITTIAPNDLTVEQIASWKSIQNGDAELASPLFCPELVQAIGRRHQSVEVAVLEQSEQTVGFFPFHRSAPIRGQCLGLPFAGPLGGLQGAVMPASLELDPKRLMRDCGLCGWSFNQLLAKQQAFETHHVVLHEFPFMDLSRGFETYRQERRQAKSDELREAMRKERKIQREWGVIRFEPYESDPHVLDTVLNWKTEQLEAMEVPNALQEVWISPLLGDLLDVRTDGFAGMLSAMYVGETLAAATIGVRSRTILHGWVTAFNKKFCKYSPGLLLLLQLARSAETLGIERIDMGRGNESFKKSFASGSLPLAEGSVDLHPLAGAIKQNWLRAREWLKTTSLAGPAKRWVDRARIQKARRSQEDTNAHIRP